MDDEYYKELMAPFVHWWLVDNPDWVEQRNKDWAFLEKKCYADEPKKEVYEVYFKTGVKTAHIPENTQFLLTPIPSEFDAREFFLSKNFSDLNKQNIMSNYIRLSSCASELSWYRQHVKFFSEGILGNEFKELKIKWGRKEKVYTPNPSGWAVKYSIDSIKLLKQEELFPGLVDSVNYFVSCLGHVNDEVDRKLVKINDLLEAIDHTLEDSSASDIAKEFAEKLKARETDIKANWALNAHLDG